MRTDDKNAWLKIEFDGTKVSWSFQGATRNPSRKRIRLKILVGHVSEAFLAVQKPGMVSLTYTEMSYRPRNTDLCLSHALNLDCGVPIPGTRENMVGYMQKLFQEIDGSRTPWKSKQDCAVFRTWHTESLLRRKIIELDAPGLDAAYTKHPKHDFTAGKAIDFIRRNLREVSSGPDPISMGDFQSYKYVVCCESSDGFLWNLYSDCVPIVIEQPDASCVSWINGYAKPGEHYVPSTIDGLQATIEKLRTDDGMSRHVAESGKALASSLLAGRVTHTADILRTLL